MQKKKFLQLIHDFENRGYTHQELAACIGVPYKSLEDALKKAAYKPDIFKKLSDFFNITFENDLVDQRNKTLKTEAKHLKNVSQVLRYLMNDVGSISEGELFRRTGVPQPTIHRILSGMTPNPREQAIKPLADFFKVTTDQLLARVPLSKERIPGTFDHEMLLRKSLPILSFSDVIKWPSFAKKIAQSSWAHWVTSETVSSEKSFAVKLDKDSSFRMFKKDSLIIVDYAKKPADGSYVIVHADNANEAIIARYNTDKKLLVLDDKATKIYPSTKQSRILGVIVEIRRLLEEESC